MSIETFSIFYFGTEITEDNRNLNFDEGGPELSAVLEIGSHTHTELETVLTTALDAAGALTYTVTFNRTARTYTIAATGTFALLISSGSQIGTGTFTLLGFTGADVTGAATYTSNTTSAQIYEPQFKLQDYVSEDDQQEKIDPSVNEAATGDLEIIAFGIRKILDANIRFATNRDMSLTGVIKNNATGVADLRTFMQTIIDKGPFELMEDIGNRTLFKKVLLESTPESPQGTAYRLKELSMQNGPTGFFDTGLLRFRVFT